MIAETISGAYDGYGTKVIRPFDRRKGPKPTFPIGRYVSQPLTVECKSINEVVRFLRGCKAVSDQEQFGKEEYWLPPDEFEKTRRGDCEDFALWTWRQLLALGYDARFVAGRSGRYGVGHAWVEFFRDDRCYLVEPQLCALGPRMPRLTTLKYQPRISVTWDGEKLGYYEHRAEDRSSMLFDLVRMVPEYVWIWGIFWLSSPLRIPRAIRFVLRRFFRGFRWPGNSTRRKPPGLARSR